MPGQATSALNLQADKIFELYETEKTEDTSFFLQ